MTVAKIGDQDGITAARNALVALDGAHHAAYEKQAVTLGLLKDGHNEGLDRLAAVEGQLVGLPFLRPPAAT